MGDHVRDDDYVGEQVREQVDDHVSDHVPIARDLMRAEAMAAYTRSLLEPLVARLAEQEGVIRDLERENGRQGAELERAASALVAAEGALTAQERRVRRPGLALVILAGLAALGIVATAAPAWVR